MRVEISSKYLWSFDADDGRNAGGYEAAILARRKLTHVAPVWYQIRQVNARVEVTGGHDVNKTFLQLIKEHKSKVGSQGTPR